MIHDLTTGTVFRNPKAHLRSVHAYFPSVVLLASGELLAAYVLGEAFEAVNDHVALSVSEAIRKVFSVFSGFHAAVW